jgi:hypothetical protein
MKQFKLVGTENYEQEVVQMNHDAISDAVVKVRMHCFIFIVLNSELLIRVKEYLMHHLKRLCKRGTTQAV